MKIPRNNENSTAIHEERRISMYLQAIEDLGHSNPESKTFFEYMNLNVKKLFDRLIYK